ncbi:hypothetical protein [Hyalangium versicolor]|uniref:hypothetical protein n=1 Tax=Hyalangium versicolor TaxID=2861190 RepID=UPI001CCCE546|nr:hypothetical protein [Hyalangium versicolor]
MKKLMVGVATVLTVVFVGCASSNPGPSDAGSVERGPKVLPIEGDPNGLWWDDASHTLYLADDNGNRILQWTDAGGFAFVKGLPAAAPEGAGLGQLVLTKDGTIIVTRFGYGTTGDVVFVPASGEPQIVPGLDPTRRRIGLTVTSDGKLFDSWFVRLATGARVGAIGELSLSGTEPEVITGLKKPIGVLAVGDSLIVSDQDLGQILKAPRSNPSAYQVLATVATPDLLAAGPDGSIFTGSTGGNLYRISATGETAVFSSGFQQVRGVAYDPTNRRLFVADHDGDESNGVSHVLHILPVD